MVGQTFESLHSKFARCLAMRRKIVGLKPFKDTFYPFGNICLVILILQTNFEIFEFSDLNHKAED